MNVIENTTKHHHHSITLFQDLLTRVNRKYLSGA
jgi:hypothetical protein